jgi:hypothetical protein
LINATIGGGPVAGFGTDYQQGEAENGNGWERVGDNAAKSAAILAAIFGTAAVAGGGSAGGAAGGTTGGTGVGTGSGIGAENGGLMVDNGAGGAGAGFDWQGMAQNFMGQGGFGQLTGGGQQQGQQPAYGGGNAERDLVAAMMQQQAMERMKQEREQGLYSPAGRRGV